jgi:hypothetical protein
MIPYAEFGFVRTRLNRPIFLDDYVCRMSGEAAERDRTGWRHPDRVVAT